MIFYYLQQLQTDDSDNGKTSLWKKTPEAKEDRLLKLGQTIPQLVKQVEVCIIYIYIYNLLEISYYI